MTHLDELNPAQREAVSHIRGPLLVLAGAGAGKTRVIAHRVLEIVRSGVAPEEILCITFTNKAAREMRERISLLLRESPERTRPALEEARAPLVSTFHSLGLYIIKENYRALGLTRFPVIYDRSDTLKAIKQALKEGGAGDEMEPRAALSVISRHKGEGVTAEEYAAGAEGPREFAVATCWRGYERILRADGALDFDDLLARTVAFLQTDEHARRRYQSRWRYIHIDEYQDTNRLQSEMVRLLAGGEKNVCAVGDIDQTIYTWRGADIQNIMRFEKRYPGATTIVLEENYRSTQTILAAANEIISKNVFRVEKTLFTKNREGDRLFLYQAMNEDDEGQYVARKIEESMERKVRPRDIAVLYRANFQSRAIEEALLSHRIPYQVIGTRFFERAEVKNALSFIRAALYGADVDIARIGNVAPRGLGKMTLLAMLSKKEASLPARAQNNVANFRQLLARIGEKVKELPPSQLIEYVVKQSGMEKSLKEDRAEGGERLENLRELAALARRYDLEEAPRGAELFLEGAALASDQDELKDEADAVRLMTVHASKGLEFAHVFITGLEEGLFPYSREEDGGRDTEEERRLMYVALTRAQKNIFLSFASMRTVFGAQSFCEPSQFIADIPEELLELEAPERLGKTIYLK